jgi:hypothetical protein
MPKFIKILAGFVVVVVIAVVVVISTIDVNQYKGDVITAVEDATGRKLQIDGDLGFAVSLVPTVVVEDVKFSNASWGSKPEMVSLKKLEVKIALLPLLTGDIQVNKIVLIDPQILLETNKKGTGNWVFASNKKQDAAETEKEAGKAPSVIVNEVQIENATLIYNDGVTGEKTNLVIDQITAAADDVDEPLSLIIKAAYNEIPVAVKGQLGSLQQLTENDEYPVDLAIEVSGASLAVKGQINKPMDGKGINLVVKFAVDSLAELSKLAGSDLPDYGPITVTGTITDGKNSYSIKSFELKASNTDLSGDVTAALGGKRPSITAKLTSKLIDLAELASDEEQAEQEKVKNERVFSSDPLAFDGLKAVNANVSINAKQINTSSMSLTDTVVTVSLKDGNLLIKPLSSLVAGGKLAGSINLNASGKSALLSTNITLLGLEPNKITDLSDKLTGAKTDLTVDVKGSGKSMSQIMSGLNGKFVVQVGEGVITDNVTGALGADVLTELVGMLNPFSKSKEATKLQCAVVNFTIKDGMATTDKGIAFSTNQMNIIGSGEVNLKTEAIDIGIKPEAKEGVGINAGKLASLVRVGGTLAQPKPTADLMGAVSTGLSVSTAVATGGLSLLASGLLDRATADADPCATAMGKKSSQTTQQSEKSAPAKATDAVKDAGNAVSNTLKGFFN